MLSDVDPLFLYCSVWIVGLEPRRVLFILATVLASIFSVLTMGRTVRARSHPFLDDKTMIDGTKLSEHLKYPPMDAVYTWVNGSDPVWFSEMQKYRREYNWEHQLPVEDESDTATSSNRFRDNDELRCVCRTYLILETVFVHWRSTLRGSATFTL